MYLIYTFQNLKLAFLNQFSLLKFLLIQLKLKVKIFLFPTTLEKLNYFF